MNLKLKTQNFIIILSILAIILFNFLTTFYYNNLIKNDINNVININSEIIEKTTNIEKNFYQQANIIFQNLLIIDQDELNSSYDFLNELIKELQNSQKQVVLMLTK